MAASDSTPLPIKNQALQITFGMWLTTGLINSGATSPDSEISKDGGAYADCTNEISEIGSSGTYTLDMTSTEMNADVVAIQVKSGTANAITYKITIYPSSLGKMQVDLRSILATLLTETSGQLAGGFKKLFDVAAPTGTLNSLPAAIPGASNGLVIAGTNAAITLSGSGLVLAAMSIGGNANSAQSGDGFARIGANGIGLTAVALTGTQAFNNTGTWTGNLSGSVGSVGSAVTVTGDTATAATRLLTMLVVDGGVYQFTANALELAPTGGSAPTADQNAAALLKLDWTTVSGEASRSVLNALRFLRNGFSISGSTLSVLGEDDTTVVYTRDLATDAAAIPIVGVS